MDRTEFEQIVNAQDNLIKDLDVDVWIGMEPTFTRRFAETPEWLSEALGPEKLQFAYALLNEVYKHQSGGVVLHTLGRQYVGEDLPRWNIGYYQARNNQFTWEGPPDPCLVVPKLTDTMPEKAIDIVAFWQALNNALSQSSWQSTAFVVEEVLKYRLLFRCDGSAAVADIKNKPQLARTSVHDQEIPLDGLIDELSANGDLLLCLDLHTMDSPHHTGTSVVIELPAVPNVIIFVQLLQCIAQAAKQASLETIVIQGFPPPVDASVAWTTITPDPAVIEINQAPADNASNFYQYCELFYSAAHAVGLYPYRLHYNGVVSDSGGGQFTPHRYTQVSRSPSFRQGLPESKIHGCIGARHPWHWIPASRRV